MVKLTAMERLILVNVLPKEGNLLTLRVTHELVQKLSLNATEMIAYEVRQVPEGVMFNKKGETEETDIELNSGEIATIKKTFKDMEDTEKLRLEHLPVYDKFFT